MKTVDIVISVQLQAWLVGRNSDIPKSKWDTYRYVGGPVERKALADDVRFFRERAREESIDSDGLLSVIQARAWLEAFKWAVRTGAAVV